MYSHDNHIHGRVNTQRRCQCGPPQCYILVWTLHCFTSRIPHACRRYAHGHALCTGGQTGSRKMQTPSPGTWSESCHVHSRSTVYRVLWIYIVRSRSTVYCVLWIYIVRSRSTVYCVLWIYIVRSRSTVYCVLWMYVRIIHVLWSIFFTGSRASREPHGIRPWVQFAKCKSCPVASKVGVNRILFRTNRIFFPITNERTNILSLTIPLKPTTTQTQMDQTNTIQIMDKSKRTRSCFFKSFLYQCW